MISVKSDASFSRCSMVHEQSDASHRPENTIHKGRNKADCNKDQPSNSIPGKLVNGESVQRPRREKTSQNFTSRFATDLETLFCQWIYGCLIYLILCYGDGDCKLEIINLKNSGRLHLTVCSWIPKRTFWKLQKQNV